MPVWDPEVEVDVERARALIGAQFPDLADAPMRQLATGWDNVVHLVDERWVFRFPRRQVAVAGVEREIDVLRRLAPNLPLPVPLPRFIGAPAGDYPWPWFGAAHLPGVELAESGWSDAERVTVGAEVGAFLRELHAGGLSGRVGSTLPVDPMRRADMPFRVAATRKRLDDLAAAHLWEPTREVEALLDDAMGLPPPPRTVVLHGDLHVRHVLVDGGHVTGIIDWGDLCAGDPSIDLSIAYGSLLGEGRSALIDAYGPIDGLTELRARVIAVFLAAALLEYADDQRLAPLRAEALRAIERAVA
jgi:aminoglycoside phosphotransferase (APT) family kinase protein